MAALTEYDSTGVKIVTPTPTGDGGQALNDNFKLLAYSRRTIPNSVVVVAFTIPAISANSRHELTINLGTLKNSRRALVGFFSSGATDSQIQNLAINSTGTSLANQVRIAAAALSANTSTEGVIPALLSPAVSRGIMVVTTDYAQASRCVLPYNETIGSSTALVAGYTYNGINQGALFGYYSAFGVVGGVLGLNKKVQMESAWLTTSGTDAILHLAFYNNDSAANTSLSLKVAAFE